MIQPCPMNVFCMNFMEIFDLKHIVVEGFRNPFRSAPPQRNLFAGEEIFPREECEESPSVKLKTTPRDAGFLFRSRSDRTDFCTTGCNSAKTFFSLEMFSVRSSSAESTVIGVTVSVLKNVELGDVGSLPINAVIGAIFFRCGEGELLSALRTNGKRSDQPSIRKRSSDTTDRKMRAVPCQFSPLSRCSKGGTEG